MNDRELHKFATEQLLKVTEMHAANTQLSLTAQAARACYLKKADENANTPQRLVVLAFDTPAQADAFLAALKKAIAQQ